MIEQKNICEHFEFCWSYCYRACILNDRVALGGQGAVSITCLCRHDCDQNSILSASSLQKLQQVLCLSTPLAPATGKSTIFVSSIQAWFKIYADMCVVNPSRKFGFEKGHNVKLKMPTQTFCCYHFACPFCECYLANLPNTAVSIAFWFLWRRACHHLTSKNTQMHVSVPKKEARKKKWFTGND